MELNTSLLIQLIAYTFLIGCCLRYLRLFSSKAVKADGRSYQNKQQLEELKQTQKALQYYHDKFTADLYLAKKGQLRR